MFAALAAEPTTNLPLRPRRLRFRVMLCALFLVLFQLWTLATAGIPGALSGIADFRSLYSAGLIVRTGHASSLYADDVQRQIQDAVAHDHKPALPFVYPAYAALPFVALSLFSYRTAYILFLAINLLLLLASTLILRPYLGGLARLWPPLPAALFLGFVPVGVALMQGQFSVILLLLYCACFAAIQHNRLFLAGIFLALALIKFHLVLVIVLLFVLWRRWRIVAGFAAGATALALTSLSICGVSGTRGFGASLRSAAGTPNAPQLHFDVASAAKMPNLHGLFFLLTGASVWASVLLVAASLAVFVWTMRQPPSLPRALVASLLISFHLQMHDLTLLLLPLSLILNRQCARMSSPERHNPLAAASPGGFPWPTAAALAWMLSPVLLLLMATGDNPWLALAMLPLLLPSQPHTDSSVDLLSKIHPRDSFDACVLSYE